MIYIRNLALDFGVYWDTFLSIFTYLTNKHTLSPVHCSASFEKECQIYIVVTRPTASLTSVAKYIHFSTETTAPLLCKMTEIVLNDLD
jgi:hypothetical protein